MGWKKALAGIGKAAAGAALNQAGVSGLGGAAPTTKRSLCKKLATLIASDFELEREGRIAVFRGLLGAVDAIEDGLESAHPESEDQDGDWDDEDEAE